MDEQQNRTETLNDTSQLSVPPPPIIYQSGTETVQQKTLPTAGMVIGIVLLVFGGIALLSLLSSVSGLRGGASNPVYRMLPHWYWAMSAAGNVITGICEIVMGIGLLRVVAWARKGAIYWMIFSMVTTTVIMVIMSSLLTKSPLPIPSMPGEGASIVHGAMIASMIVSTIFSLGINGLMIFFLTRPTMVAAYDKKS